MDSPTLPKLVGVLPDALVITRASGGSDGLGEFSALHRRAAALEHYAALAARWDFDDGSTGGSNERPIGL